MGEITRLSSSLPGDPTHAVEAEQAVLGALLLGADITAAIEAAGGIDLFYDPVHADLYKVIAGRVRRNELADAVIVANMLRHHVGLNELGGGRYVARIAGTASLTAAPAYVAQLADALHRRRIGQAIADASAGLLGAEPAQMVARRLEAALLAAAPAQGSTRPTTMQAAIMSALDQVNAAYQNNGPVGLRSGILSLDRLVAGFYPGELILLGGRPSMGKTAVALAIALYIARMGRPVVICSLEMTADSIALRALANAAADKGTGVAYSAMRRGDLGEDEMRAVITGAQSLADLPIWILPPTLSEIAGIVATVQGLARQIPQGLGLVVIDYLQLMRGAQKNRFEEITAISIACKAMARELNVPVLALSQLSRQVEQREDKRPMLSDLRESGQLEQDADTVLFVYREAYYLEREKPSDDKLEAMAAWQEAAAKHHNRLEIIVAKQRQGATATAHVRFNPATNVIWEDMW